MRPARLLPLIAVAVLLSCRGPAEDGVSEETKTFLPQSDFVFRGTVLLHNTATIALDDVSDLAVVRVDEVVDAPPALEKLVGQQITVKLKDLEGAPVGGERVFFTSAWHFGESVGVIEVGSYAIERQRFRVERLRKEIQVWRQAEADRQLRARLQEARLVIAGQVASVRPHEREGGPWSEHDPEWWEAVITVEDILKGRVEDSTVVVLYANSVDVMWYDSPKLQVGEEGIWILPSASTAHLLPEQLLITDQKDLQPKSELDRLRTLLRR